MENIYLPSKTILMGIIVTLVIISAAFIIVYSLCKNNEQFSNPFEAKVNENQKLNQPLAFEEEWLASPCKPWVGCLYPMPNPINIQTGERDHEPDVKTCEKAWKDCPAYANCINKKCKAKDGIYNGF